MEENTKYRPVKIRNNLLNYIVNQTLEVGKEKLLNSIRQLYSEEEIIEAHKILLGSIPQKRATRRARCVKNPDLLIAIYDCLQLVNFEDLPTFVAQNGSRIARQTGSRISRTKPLNGKLTKTVDLHSKTRDCASNKTSSKQKLMTYDNANEKGMKEDEPILTMSQSTDVSIYKKEQRQMRFQISEMVAMINDMKEGLRQISYEVPKPRIKQEAEIEIGLLDSPEMSVINFFPENTIMLQNGSISEAEETFIFNDSNQDGLALLQKLIDEDDDVAEIDDLFEEEENVAEDSNRVHLHVQEDERPDEVQAITSGRKVHAKKKKRDAIFKNPSVVVLPGKQDNKVILIREEEHIAPLEICEYELNLDDGNTIEISSSDDFIGQLEELEGISTANPNFIDAEASEQNRQSSRSKYQQLCPICNQEFTSVLALWKHNLKEHITVLTFDCFLCKSSFTSRQELHSHFAACLSIAKQSHNLDEKTCQICGSFHATEKSLKMHLMYHSENRKFICEFCALRFSTMPSLELHIKNNHNPLNTFQCCLCPLSFISNHFLMSHMWTHTGEKPFQCRSCHFLSATRSKLHNHLKTHTSQKKVECRVCSYTCLGLAKLSKHMVKNHAHPLVCSKAGCGKLFTDGFQYKRHCDDHLCGEAKFKCPLCLYKTSIKGSEIKHAKTHLNPFHKCPFCQVNLASRHNVTRHVKQYCKMKFRAESF